MKKYIIIFLLILISILVNKAEIGSAIAGNLVKEISKTHYIAQNSAPEKKISDQTAQENKEPPKSVSDLPLPKTKTSLATEKPVEEGIDIPDANPEPAPGVLEQNPFVFVQPQAPSEIQITSSTNTIPAQAEVPNNAQQPPSQKQTASDVPVQAIPAPAAAIPIPTVAVPAPGLPSIPLPVSKTLPGETGASNNKSKTPETAAKAVPTQPQSQPTATIAPVQTLPGQTPSSSPQAAIPAQNQIAQTQTSGQINQTAPQAQIIPPQTKTPPSQPQTQTPSPATAPKEKLPLKLSEEISIFNVPTANLKTMKTIIDQDYNLVGLVYGEELGYLHLLSADSEGNFKEVWKSPPFNSPIRGVFVDDLDGDGETEIVAYTANGNFYIYSYNNRQLKYRTSEGTYLKINCMIITSLDNPKEKKILFIGVKPSDNPKGKDENEQTGASPGRLIQFNPKSLFEEWTSQEKYTATDIIVGNVDNDPQPEIILNTGEVLDCRFKDLKWKSDIPFGTRLYLIDLDSDGLLELVTEYNESYVRVFDVDQHREKW